MLPIVVIPPEPIVALDEARDYLRTDGTDDDALIQRLIAAVTAFAEKEAQRPIGWQQLEITRSSFYADNGCSDFVFDYPVSSDSIVITYKDLNGDEHTVPADNYELMDGDTLSLNTGASWPSDLASRNAVTIRFWAGFQPVPADIVQAVLLLVSQYYDMRSTVTLTPLSEVPGTFSAILKKHRVFS